MNQLSKIYFCLCMIQSATNFSQYFNSSHAMASSTVILNGKKFTHTKTSDNGVQSEQFLINNVPVEQDEYNNELNSLKLAQMNQQANEAQRKADEQENMKNNLKSAMLSKLVTQSLIDLQDNLATLHESVLKPYLIFNHQGINSQSELEQLNNWTKQLHKNLHTTLANQNFTTLQKLAEDIESKVEQVRSCLKQSMQQATKQCDDTTILKKLLELVEA
ncbi:hypothetical protein KBB68_03640 [Candidatus Babeliales bacterium]|nr:hypothetical protein [Candidatus Babeliales bacterium]